MAKLDLTLLDLDNFWIDNENEIYNNSKIPEELSRSPFIVMPKICMQMNINYLTISLMKHITLEF